MLRNDGHAFHTRSSWISVFFFFNCDGVDLQAQNGVSGFKVKLFHLVLAAEYILLLTGFCIWTLSRKPKNSFYLCAHHFIVDLYFYRMEVKLAFRVGVAFAKAKQSIQGITLAQVNVSFFEVLMMTKLAYFVFHLFQS